MLAEAENSIIRLGFIQLWIAILLLAGLVNPAQGSATTITEVYSVLDLTNRAMDVLLVKSKGITKVKDPRYLDHDLTTIHLYQLEVSNLQLLRRIQRKFTMAPTPLIVAPPEKPSKAEVKLLAARLLAEVRRLAIQINIWGLPEQKQTFANKSASDAFALLARIRVKLLLLGGLPQPKAADLAQEFQRGVTAISSILTTIDPAQRYKIMAPAPAVSNLAKLYPLAIKVRSQLNETRRFLKLRPRKLPKNKSKQVVSGMEIYLQSQIILAELNILKARLNDNAVTPLATVPQGATLQDAAHLLASQTFLLSQLRPLTAMVQQGDK